MHHTIGTLRLTEAEAHSVREAVAEAEIRGVGAVTVALACDGDSLMRLPQVRGALTVYHDPLGFQRLVLDWQRLEVAS